MKKILADYMENGFLENIVDMFKHDKTLYLLIGELMADERSRVRIGTVALVEILKKDYYHDISVAIHGIAKLLKNPNTTIRGDAAYLLGIIGHKDALPFLSGAFNNGEENEIVKETIRESIEIINQMSCSQRKSKSL
ncbi:MAG: HEAT repeat domain-containing protein [Thermodesulfovibrionia bacterium]|nr:HEAT repeat domain-containing protein [Thermodesulfovibrionia bacterium]